jgi:hypothetical protein
MLNCSLPLDISPFSNVVISFDPALSLLIVAGAVIFSSWEEGWDLVIGSYFCFITLSTIGFGDYVPGSNSYQNNLLIIYY